MPVIRIMGRDVELVLEEPEQAAEEFQQQVQNGIGDDQALEDARLAAEVQAMDLATYSARRKNLVRQQPFGS